MEANNLKLAEAQQAQAELMRKQRALDEEKRELDLTIEKRVQASVDQIHAKARQEADEAARLRVAEKDQTIESMTRTIEELKRKAEQGSQQSQGEVLELELEELLKSRFPMDVIEPVGKGELGADMIQQVNGQLGQPAGIILWETKRTKAGAMGGWPSCATISAAPGPMWRSSFLIPCPNTLSILTWLTAYGWLTRAVPCRLPSLCAKRWST